jgi:hypothetical protein
MGMGNLPTGGADFSLRGMGNVPTLWVGILFTGSVQTVPTASVGLGTLPTDGKGTFLPVLGTVPTGFWGLPTRWLEAYPPDSWGMYPPACLGLYPPWGSVLFSLRWWGL